MSLNARAKTVIAIAALVVVILTYFSCSQETQNKAGRSVQNWTGVDGVLEVYAGDKLVKRFLKIDKLSTAAATSKDVERSYRYGYGYLDANLNFRVDPDEKKVYFEISDFTNYIFYENPNITDQ
ncbi:hypothetical protein [Salidesulfovibrio onnuriiensis]|uniref:hypothetical protein n=1 Tax=Salidesulfovibrio onnuriiensis TaxID=2583823 RepID=UPI0011CB59BB|nr:hypothetical protein [Salidesulfovibrio onnuriiensis]